MSLSFREGPIDTLDELLHRMVVPMRFSFTSFAIRPSWFFLSIKHYLSVEVIQLIQQPINGMPELLIPLDIIGC